MKRITDSNPNRYRGRTNVAWKKLQELEDLEAKLKIELPVFVAACLRNKIYSKFWGKYVYFTGEEDAITPEGFVCYTSGQNELYRYEDYKKTWGLCEIDLVENELNEFLEVENEK